MNLQEFIEYNWRDGSITALIFDKDCLKLTIIDWKDQVIEVKFEDVFKLSLHDYFDEDISHIKIMENDENEISISIFSAWEDRKMLCFSLEIPTAI